MKKEIQHFNLQVPQKQTFKYLQHTKMLLRCQFIQNYVVSDNMYM